MITLDGVTYNEGMTLYYVDSVKLELVTMERTKLNPFNKTIIGQRHGLEMFYGARGRAVKQLIRCITAKINSLSEQITNTVDLI